MNTGLCSPRDGTKRYAPKIGSSHFYRHLEMHRQARFNDSSAPIQLSSEYKERLIDAAAAAVVHDSLLLAFAYHKTGFMSLVKTLIEIGQSYSAASSIDMSSLLPTGTAVREGVMYLLEKRNRGIKSETNEILQLRGGILCDGVKVETNGNKYFHFNISYIERRRRHLNIREKWSMQCKLLFMARH